MKRTEYERAQLAARPNNNLKSYAARSCSSPVMLLGSGQGTLNIDVKNVDLKNEEV